MRGSHLIDFFRLSKILLERVKLWNSSGTAVELGRTYYWPPDSNYWNFDQRLMYSLLLKVRYDVILSKEQPQRYVGSHLIVLKFWVFQVTIINKKTSLSFDVQLLRATGHNVEEVGFTGDWITRASYTLALTYLRPSQSFLFRKVFY